MRLKVLSLVVIVAVLAVALAPTASNAQEGANTLTLTRVGAFYNGTFFEGASEISAYDAESSRLFVTNGASDTLDIIDITDPTAPERIAQIDITQYGGGLNSVASANGLVAVAVEAEESTDDGSVVFLTPDGTFLGQVAAGALPDMVTFSPDGSKVLVANEGEPNDDYSIDPEGSITIIDVSMGDFSDNAATQIYFSDFNAGGPRAAELPADVRVFGPNASVAQDLEPEYIAVSPDGSTAFVGLQEANALAVIDIESASISAILALGFKDHSLEGNGFDASNRDDAINITTHPTLGMYMPDAIAAYEVDGAVYIVTANEGDSRDYDTFSEEARVADLTLDPEAFPNAAELQDEANLGRLLTTTVNGDTDGDGDHDVIYSLGSRSFTIWNTAGEVVFDSGDDFEQITATVIPELFNANGEENEADARSDDKGPEPESVAIGAVNGRSYAFVGFERSYGFIVYDITDPAAPVLDQFVPTRTIDEVPGLESGGDISPEGVLFIPADQSPTGVALLVISHEGSDNTVIWTVE